MSLTAAGFHLWTILPQLSRCVFISKPGTMQPPGLIFVIVYFLLGVGRREEKMLCISACRVAIVFLIKHNYL